MLIDEFLLFRPNYIIIWYDMLWSFRAPMPSRPARLNVSVRGEWVTHHYKVGLEYHLFVSVAGLAILNTKSNNIFVQIRILTYVAEQQLVNCGWTGGFDDLSDSAGCDGRQVLCDFRHGNVDSGWGSTIAIFSFLGFIRPFRSIDKYL